MAQLGAYEIATLFAGDADLVHAVEAIQRLGKQVNLVIPEDSSSISDEMLRLAAKEAGIQVLRVRIL